MPPAIRAVTFWSEGGGSRKSTMSENTAAMLGRRGLDVLLIDLDPQPGSVTAALGYKEEKTRRGEHLGDVLIDTREMRLPELIIEDMDFDLVPAHEGLAQFDQQLVASNVRVQDKLLFAEIRELRDVYDVFIVDAPAGLNKLADNALFATRNLLVPLELSPKGYDSVEGLMRTVDSIVSNYQIDNPEFDIDILGLIPNATVDSNVVDWVNEDISEEGWNVLPVEFGQRSIMQEAWYHRMNIFAYMESEKSGRVREYQREHVENVFGAIADLIQYGQIPSEPMTEVAQ